MNVSSDSNGSFSGPKFKGDILDGRVSSNESRVPESIQKELDRRRIGDRLLLKSSEAK